MNALIRKLRRFITINRLIIITFSALIIYFELISYRNYFCENKKVFLENCKFSDTHRKGNLFILNILDLERFGDEFQNFILSIISRKNQNNKLELNEEEVIIIV